MFTILKNVLLFVLLLTVIVSIHELGHLIAAKIFGVYCKEYSIGMGPKIYSHQFKETEFCIRALPFGGFVAMAGDEENDLETKVDTTDLPPERTLPGIAKWKRVIVMFAGIIMNMILAWIIYSLIIFNNGIYDAKTEPIIDHINETMPAYNSGLQSGDIITKIEFENGASLYPKTYSEIPTFSQSYYDGNGPWIITVKRDNESSTYKVTPIFDQNEGRYLIGIYFTDGATEFVPTNIINCWYYGFDYLLSIIRLIGTALITLLKGIGLESLSGPIGIYKTVEEVASYGIGYYIELIAMLSVNVGLFNAIPLPIFDGGRVLLLFIELIIGKPLSKKAENFVMSASLVLLIMLMVFVTGNDIFRILRG